MRRYGFISFTLLGGCLTALSATEADTPFYPDGLCQHEQALPLLEAVEKWKSCENKGMANKGTTAANLLPAAFPSQGDLIQGASDFLVNRAKQEITIYALEQVKKTFSGNSGDAGVKLLKASFPTTLYLFGSGTPSTYVLILSSLKNSVSKDLKDLPANIAMNPDIFRELVPVIPESGDSARLALFRDLLNMSHAVLNGANWKSALSSGKYSGVFFVYGQLLFYHDDMTALSALKKPENLEIAGQLLNRYIKQHGVYGKVDTATISKILTLVEQQKSIDWDTGLSNLQKIGSLMTVMKSAFEVTNPSEIFPSTWSGAVGRLESLYPLLSSSTPQDFAMRLSEIPSVKQRPALQRFTLFLGVIGAAESGEDVSAAVEAFAEPVGSWRRKRVSGYAVGLQSYVGLSGALTKDSANNFSVQPFIPIGLEFSWHYFGILVGMADLGATVQLQSGEGATFEWKDIFSPGLYGTIGFGNTPFSVLTGAQLQYDSDEKAAPRFLLAIAVDIPLMPLHGWSPE